jgi:hypothetical protein
MIEGCDRLTTGLAPCHVALDLWWEDAVPFRASAEVCDTSRSSAEASFSLSSV